MLNYRELDENEKQKYLLLNAKVGMFFNAQRGKDPGSRFGGLVTSLMFETTRQALVYEYRSIFSLQIEFIPVVDVQETYWGEVNHANAHSN